MTLKARQAEGKTAPRSMRAERGAQPKARPAAGPLVGPLAGAGALNLVKLCVGAGAPSDLAAWHRSRAAAHGAGWTPRHTTRMQPKRADELLDGGSLYWVFKGLILARQRLLAIEPSRGADGVQRHDLVLEGRLILTRPQPRRPFQGWRYLPGAEAPADASSRGEGSEIEDALPADLEQALDALGVL